MTPPLHLHRCLLESAARDVWPPLSPPPPPSHLPRSPPITIRLIRTRRKDDSTSTSSSTPLHPPIIRRVALSNDGLIILHVTQSSSSSSTSSTLTDDTSHTLIALSLSGYETGRAVMPAAITYMECVGRADYVLVGAVDGRVAVYLAQSMVLLWETRPWLEAQCVAASYPTAANLPSLPSAILCARLGPSDSHPALLTISTAMGELYLKPVPDFIRWERNRAPSALAQMMSGPLQAVRGTLQQASSLTAWTSEQAGALATNARSFADEALSDWTKCVL